MLTSDLVRMEIDATEIRPRYLKRKHAAIYLKIARDIITIFHAHQGKTRRELEQALSNYESDRVGYKILRGLVKILDSFAEFEPAESLDYPEFRKLLFRFVEQHRPIIRQPDLLHPENRKQVLEKFARQYVPLPRNLYGDLPDFHILQKIDFDFTPDILVRRYNLALAQGILYRCHRMVIRIWDGYRTMFHYLKLAHLMHRVFHHGEYYVVEIDGPHSLFNKTQKYGVNLARFLPGLLLAEKWEMDALVNTSKGERHFYLNQNCGLQSYYKQAHPFDSIVEETFYDQFAKRETEWQISREDAIIDIGETVLIPDFRFVHAAGREFLLEIVGFWTPEYLEKKIAKLKSAGCKNMIVAVNSQLNCTKEDFAGPVIFYKTRLKVKDVLAILDKKED